jgi:hypothetical protein
MDLKEIGKVDPDNFWYYLYKGQFIFNKAIKSFNKSEILFDVGAGSGYFASIFVKNKKTSKAFCIDPFYSEDQLGIKNDLNINSNFLKVKSYAAIFRILYNGTYLNKENSARALTYLTKLEFSKGIRAAVPADVLVAHKYGSRDEFDAKGNSTNIQLHHFGIVYHKQKPFLIGIMTRGGKKEVREKIIYDLSKLTYDEVESFCKKNGLDN